MSRGRASDGMPAEVAFLNPEKYELQETESKEDTVRSEEIPMWNDNVRNEELGIVQDAARYMRN